MAAGGHARARARGHYTWPKAVNCGQAGPNLIYITLYGWRWQDLGGIYISGILGGRMRSSLKLAKSAKGGWTVTTGLLFKRWSQGVAQRRVQTKNIHRTTDFKIVYMFLKLLGWDQTKKNTLKGWFGNRVYKNRNLPLISFVKLKKYIHDFRMKPSVSISHRNFRFLQENSCTRFLNSALRV